MRVSIFICCCFSLLLTSCSIKKDPEFQRVKSIEIANQSSNKIQFLIDLEFKNPNLVGGTFESKNLNFYVNEFEFSQLETKPFEVPANDLFNMPVYIELNKETFKGNTFELIAKVAEIAFSKNIDLSIKGDLDYKVLGYSNTYKIDYQEKISLKKK